MSKHHGKKRPSFATGETGGDLEQTRILAYELYIQRGMEEGHDWEDWFNAEREIETRKSKVAAA